MLHVHCTIKITKEYDQLGKLQKHNIQFILKSYNYLYLVQSLQKF